MRRMRSSIQVALVGSVGLHIGFAALLLLLRTRTPEPVELIDTSTDRSRVAFEVITERTVMRPPVEPIAKPADGANAAASSQTEPVGEPVVIVALTPMPQRPVGTQRAPSTESVSAIAPVAPPIHGSLKAGQAIVYVLDASGSMGEWGKFESACRSLLATLRVQSESTRVQVIVYDSVARSLVPGECLTATADHVKRIELALARCTPAGRSDHAAGLSAALTLKPDFVLMLTDADDWNAHAIRSVLRTRPAAIICTARVTPHGVEAPRELK